MKMDHSQKTYFEVVNRVVIIHHNDMDGYVSAMCAAREPSFNGKEIEFIEATYNTKFDFTKMGLDNHTVVCIVDFSLPVHVMDELIAKVGVPNIYWIDHHASAISKYANYENEKYIKGIRASVNLSATELACFYFLMNGTLVSVNGETAVFNFGSAHVDRDWILMNVPKNIHAVGDFDTFRTAHIDDNAAIFNYGFHTLSEKPSAYPVPFWDSFFAINGPENELYDRIMDAGSYVFTHDKRYAERLVKLYAFEGVLRKFPDIKLIAMNHETASSLVFRSVSQNYEVGCVFIYQPDGSMTYSLYRLGLNPTKFISVAKIAETFGGGGHDNAAGFTTNGTLVVTRKEK